MQDKTAILMSQILIDSQSTVELFSNEKLLTNIHNAKHDLILHFNAGTATMSKICDLKGYDMMQYHPNGIANILSLYNVQKKHRLCMRVLKEKASLWMNQTNTYFYAIEEGYYSAMLRK